MALEAQLEAAVTASTSGADEYPQVNPQQKLVIEVVNDSEMARVFPSVSARSILHDSGKSSWLGTARNTPMLSWGGLKVPSGQAQKTADRVAEELRWKFFDKARTGANERQWSW